VLRDGNLWSELQRYRNLTSHTYDQALAQEVYDHLCSYGVAAFEAYAAVVQTWMNNWRT
jgi:hypothetical protein